MTASPPEHVRRVTVWLRKRVEPRRDLLPSDKQVLRAIAYARWDSRSVAMTRDRIAVRTGLSVRTVTRAIGRLAAAKLIEIIERGRIERGRQFCQVYRLLFSQVASRDTVSPPRRRSPSGALPATPTTAAHALISALLGRTTASRSDRPPAPGLPAAAGPAGDGPRVGYAYPFFPTHPSRGAS